MGSFDGWLDRMEYSSSPLRALLKQFVSLIRGLDGKTAEEDVNSEALMELKLVRFRTLLSEEAQVIKKNGK